MRALVPGSPVATSDVSTPVFARKVEKRFDSKMHVYSYFVTLVPGDGRIEISKDFYQELDGRMRTGQRCELALVMR